MGGSGIYSDFEAGDGCGFRGCAWSEPDNQLAIDYRIQLPTAFMGLDSTYSNGSWTVSAGGKVGATFMAGATDNHFLRGLRDEFNLDMSIALAAEARLTYALSGQLGIFVEGTYDGTFSGHVDRPRYIAATGDLYHPGVGIGGLHLQTTTLKAGLRGSF